MINDQGGLNGRKINCISLDNSGSPPKTVEVVRRLVEQDEVLGMFGILGSPNNAAVEQYLNGRKVPQFFIFAGGARFRDPHAFLRTMGVDLAFVNQTKAFGRYILAEKPDSKIAVLYQNDDFGKDHLAGLRAALGTKADTAIVRTATYEITDPTADSQERPLHNTARMASMNENEGAARDALGR
jgi:branched-chain amino acid transport system substrate-binding protein